MSKKLRYDPRFRNNGIADTSYRYSKRLDKTMGPPWFTLHMTHQERLFAVAKAQGATKQSKKRVGMPEFSWNERPVANNNERIEAERRTIERIEQAIRSLQLSISELSHAPNPSSKFVNRVNQRALADVVLQLCECVQPAIELGEIESWRPAKEAVRVCVNCGEPAPFPFGDEWYCDSCIDDVDKVA